MDTAVNMPAFEQSAPIAQQQDTAANKAAQVFGQAVNAMDAFWSTTIITKSQFMGAVRSMDKFWSIKIG